MTKKSLRKGFTIVELVIVIAVIAVLASVLIPTFSSIITKAKESAAMQQVASSYKEALALALADDGIIETDETEVVNGFTFVFKSTDGKSAEVTVPQNFNFSQVSIQSGKVVLDGEVVNPGGGQTPPVQEEPSTPKVLYAIGDSITNGSGDNSADRWTIKGGWLEHVVTEENGFDIINSKNLGISGLGFVHGDHNFTLTARDVIEKSSDLSTSGEGTGYGKGFVANKFGDYDLSKADIITVALGVNDWKDSAVTLEAYFAEMEYCLNKIRNINPTCEIYYILPFNTSVVGTYDTNYSFNKAGANNPILCFSKTLSEFREMIKEKLTTGSLKDLNIKIIDIEGLTRDELKKYQDKAADKITDDGLHPNVAGYEVIGNQLAELIK